MFACLRGELVLHGNDLLHKRMSKFQGLDKFLLGEFVGSALNHDDVVLCADINQVEIAVLALAVGRVGDEPAVDPSDSDCSNRAVKRNVADHQGGARAVD